MDELYAADGLIPNYQHFLKPIDVGNKICKIIQLNNFKDQVKISIGRNETRIFFKIW